ncbi:SAM-dependent methyltransferase [Streptomyces sp. NBC_00237]|uniref:SAM-dependent methyltransferase n=1 Tax=Streptomyces sp. NBC_00237 TaxID=2975687 RepID=UPI00224D5198|nr:SAM-dependent methyltransferase [Streptomyces sp. NBC_00237]MCX5199908.1 SAM-dependent methyltransferase [Streptomyces sp. NBC_00237]
MTNARTNTPTNTPTYAPTHAPTHAMPSSHTPAPKLTGVAATALGVTAIRAREHRRPDRLFADPYAQHFLDFSADDAPTTGTQPAPTPELFTLMADQVAVRTRFLDDVLTSAARAGTTQMVLLACGMDARSFRLDWPPATTLFEVDFADTLAYRAAVLVAHGITAGCRRTEVPTDLREDWPTALCAAGFDPGLPTTWLMEGILYALTPVAADLLLGRVTANSAPGSILALDHQEDSALLRGARRALSEELVDLWHGGPTEALAPWLARHGWQPEVHTLEELTAQYGRPVPPPFDPQHPATGRSWLATGHLPA